MNKTMQSDYKSMNQKQRLLCYLKENGTINPLQAWASLGIYRLSDAIYRLRKDGHSIQTNDIDVNNRFDEKCTVAEYFLQY
jgi:hypothetical protein